MAKPYHSRSTSKSGDKRSSGPKAASGLLEQRPLEVDPTQPLPAVHLRSVKRHPFLYRKLVDRVDDSALATHDYLYKLTVAPQMSLGNLFFSRPVIRAYVTYAGWGEGFKGRIGGIDYAQRTSGWAFGMQMETWW